MSAGACHPTAVVRPGLGQIASSMLMPSGGYFLANNPSSSLIPPQYIMGYGGMPQRPASSETISPFALQMPAGAGAAYYGNYYYILVSWSY